MELMPRNKHESLQRILNIPLGRNTNILVILVFISNFILMLNFAVANYIQIDLSGGLPVVGSSVFATYLVYRLLAADATRYLTSHRTQAHLDQDRNHQLLRMIDDMPVAVMTVDPVSFTINYANETSKSLIRSIEHLLPLKADGLVGSSVDVFHRHPEKQRRLLSDPANLPHQARINLGPEVLDLKISAVMAADGAYLGPMLTWAIVTKEVTTEQKISQLAHFDPLTGLGNRTTFHMRKAAALSHPGRNVALLFIDLDGFKTVNDTQGHGAGDLLLQEVAKRLSALCEQPDMTISRLGGDEFALLIPDAGMAAAENLAQRIIQSVAAPYAFLGGPQIFIGTSIGIALAPIHGQDGQTLLAHADLALYAAKAAGKGTYRVFSEEMESEVKERAQLQSLLRDALASGSGLFVFYQPIVDAQTGHITAREALIRWYDPVRGWISPSQFIPIAEESDIIDLLGDFVLTKACADAATWEDKARVAVNISARQLGKGNLSSIVMSALARTGLSPSRLEIEVTETAILDDENRGIGDLCRIRAMGVRVALDDFGTGYSSLTHLRAFPFDKIKIDGSFVRDAVERPECAAVVGAIADFGKRLGVATVAEGVETEAHLHTALQEGCSEVQGYYYGPPVPSSNDAILIAELIKASEGTTTQLVTQSA